MPYRWTDDSNQKTLTLWPHQSLTAQGFTWFIAVTAAMLALPLLAVLGSPVLWVCDPMHGNTESTADGTKTRRFDNVVGEGESAFRVHQKLGTYLGGVHLELTGENVTECTGGARGLTDGDLARAYKSTVDARLNYEQAMEVAMKIAGL